MEQETLEFSLSTVEENYDLRMELLQGNTDRKFYITLRDENKKINLSSNAKIAVIVAYEPRYVNKEWVYSGGYRYDDKQTRYMLFANTNTKDGDPNIKCRGANSSPNFAPLNGAKISMTKIK